MYDYLRHRIQLEYAAAWRVALSGLLAGMALPAGVWVAALILSRWVTLLTQGLLWIFGGGVIYLSLAGAIAALANQRVSRRNDLGLVAGAAVLLLLCVPLGLLMAQSLSERRRNRTHRRFSRRLHPSEICCKRSFPRSLGDCC